MTLESDRSDLSDLSDKIGAPVFALTGYAAASLGIPRGFACRCLVWLGGRFTAGVCRAFLMATAVCESAGAWRLHKTYKTYKTYKIMIGAPLYTPRVCRALFGMAQGGQIYRWGMLAFLMATVVCVLRGRGAGVRPV